MQCMHWGTVLLEPAAGFLFNDFAPTRLSTPSPLFHPPISHPPTKVIFELSGFQTSFFTIGLIPGTILALGNGKQHTSGLPARFASQSTLASRAARKVDVRGCSRMISFYGYFDLGNYQQCSRMSKSCGQFDFEKHSGTELPASDVREFR